ncbi:MULTISPECIES: arylsulfatase [Ramlibacter]|uniref:Sulfatase-like hydrolase/transferase n=1 Tax=Ramlibacter pinisoli TaxID=2682844 RepID=A0A6N8IPM6_9BURK|nr:MULTISPECIES: arylsulfatase [Ramlibacter]MBA2963798.1 arylsulfatase [Ramlibacter sp. CGMCC 1.13660]MVQ28764.1 sulfatase-like hydrolase/transferase [Ramlibacter pinisoli]
MSANDSIQRSVLPIPDRKPVTVTTYEAKDPDTRFAPITQLRPPAGAPNVLVILLDDVGFGASSAFGGPCRTPTAERLAANGLKYNRFHTTALCSPSRAAMLSGRNHHAVGMGSITEMATSAPGYNSMRPNTCAPLAEILKLNGYSTAQFGKCHEVPVFESSPIGPFDRWPTGSGFEHFYGFIGGEDNQYYPALYDDTVPVQPDRGPEDGYHLTEDIADKAIAWVRQQKSLAPDKPFFIYFAPGATHAPHHVPQEWIARYKGRFDQGWDQVREETFARQKKLGVIPADCELTARSEGIPAWSETDPKLRPVLARQMEIYAAFLEHADYHAGRVIDALADLRVLDDTLVYYIIGDNGASAEGTLNGSFHEQAVGEAPDLMTPEFLMERIDDFGTPRANNHYAVGWAHAMNTPYQWTKQVASHFGGTRNGTIVHWPGGIRAKGELRSQFHHVIDVAPTVLEAAGLPHPTFVNGVQQEPLHGVSMLYSFGDAQAAERHETQYFEMVCNRGIFHKGWMAVTRHGNPPWVVIGKQGPLADDVWELYDTNQDWTQAHDLAGRMPQKLAELQRLFELEAGKYNVFPLDDRKAERANPDIAGRPTVVRGSTQLLFPGMRRIQENAVINTKNKAHSVTAELEIADAGARGVIVAQGGSMGGWALYAHEGKLRYFYNFLGVQHSAVTAAGPLPAGKHQARMEFAYDGGGMGKGATVTLYVDGQPVGSGRVERTHALFFSMDETAEVGCDLGEPVSPDYGHRDNAFNGKIQWVQIDIDKATQDADHLVAAEERFRLIMARQ